MKRGKEIEIKLDSKYKSFIGTIDNTEPKSIYINISSWFTPKNNDDSIKYSSVINKLIRDIKLLIQNDKTILNYHKEKIIIDLDIRESGIKYNKKSYMSCEITLFQKNIFSLTSDKVIEDTKYITKKVLNNILESNNYFSFDKLK